MSNDFCSFEIAIKNVNSNLLAFVYCYLYFATLFINFHILEIVVSAEKQSPRLDLEKKHVSNVLLLERHKY